MNPLKHLTLLVLALFAVSPAIMADEEKEEKAEQNDVLSIGSKAPDLDIEHWVSNGNGKFKPVTEFEPGKVYVVEFWATWCGPCVASMPHLAELQKTYASKGVQIVSISDEDLETVEKFLKRPVRGAAPAEDDGDDKEKEDESEKEDGDKEEDEDADDKPLKGTYGALTSVYCLTTDPDQSSNKDYMEAAQQNGIPTSFIVGKDGIIEWIGHPMELDEPLSKVVDGTWNREEYQLMFAVEQAVQSNDGEKAAKLIAEAKDKFKDNKEVLEKLDKMEFYAGVQHAFQMLQQGETEDGLAKLEEVSKKANPQELMQINSAKFQLLVGTEAFDAAAKELAKLTDSEGVDAEVLNQISWAVYEAAKDNEDVPKELVQAGAAAAEKAVKGAPDNGMIIDTLAHYMHLQGDLDKAIELQQQAIEKAGEAPEEIVSEMKSFLKKMEKEKAKAEKASSEEKSEKPEKSRKK